MSDTRLTVNGMTVGDLLAFHRARFGDARMEDEGGDGGEGGKPNAEGGKEQEGKTFSQSDMDELAKKVRAEERRKASEKFADYDDLKAKAEGAKSVEEQLAELKAENAKARRDNLASRIAAAHGIAPEDADLFLTGNDEETLTAQAKRLAERESERKKRNNVVPREGNNPKSDTSSDERAFVKELFGRAAAE